MYNNLNLDLDLVNMNAFIKISEILKILSGNKNSGVNQGHSGTNVQKTMCNNPNLDLVNLNAYIKFGEYLAIHSQDIERKNVMTCTL